MTMPVLHDNRGMWNPGVPAMSDDLLLASADALAERVPDGAQVVLPRDHSGTPMELVRALVRRGVRDLRLVGVTGVGLSVDMLIGAGAVAELEAPGVSLGEFGPARRFTHAIKTGAIRMKDSTCPAMHAELQAAEKGVPFMPLRGIIGSDLLRVRDDWIVIDNPFGEDDPIVLLPAVTPDVAIFHASMVDDHGNVWIGRRHELKTLAHAARGSLVTAERRYEGDLLEDERYAAGTVPALYLDAVAIAEGGAWPCAFWDRYPADAAHMREYAEAARTEEGFRDYVARHVLGTAAGVAAE